MVNASCDQVGQISSILFLIFYIDIDVDVDIDDHDDEVSFW